MTTISNSDGSRTNSRHRRLAQVFAAFAWSLCVVLLWPLFFTVRAGAQSQAAPPAPQTPPASETAPAAESHPDQTAAEITAHEEATTFKVNVKLVTVRVVVRDAQGHAVGNLHKEDFELFDNRKPQVITHFSVEQPGSQAAREETTSDQKTGTPSV